jgi:ApeA N-terminal domain 1
MGLDLTKTQKRIRGMFWLPEQEDKPFSGILQLKAGKSARLDTASFNNEGMANWFPNRPKPKTGETITLTGDDFYKAMSPPSPRIIHGHDEQGAPVTLLRCHAGSSHSTLAMASHRFSCDAAIFGVHLQKDDLHCHGIRLHLDHLDTWVARRAFQKYSESYETEDGERKLSKLIIPISRSLSIPLSLPGYSESEFFCAWSLKDGETELSLTSRVYLDLHFDAPREWSEVLHEVHRWQWFLSLATRRAVDVREIALYRSDVRHPIGKESMRPCHVWMKRDHSRKAPESRRSGHDFHFFYSDVENVFPAMIERWNQMHKPWAAVLHRFFAISHRRGLWLNEEFLFLAQAVEALHRARSGDTDGKGIVDRAAKTAYLSSPVELQELLGDRGTFIRLFRKTRNYWTHYGEPSPESDPEVLDDLDLHDFSQKLRWIVESAILHELGVPDHCISKVWSRQWRAHIVTYD